VPGRSLGNSAVRQTLSGRTTEISGMGATTIGALIGAAELKEKAFGSSEKAA
jgi:hypothetical protein